MKSDRLNRNSRGSGVIWTTILVGKGGGQVWRGDGGVKLREERINRKRFVYTYVIDCFKLYMCQWMQKIPLYNVTIIEIAGGLQDRRKRGEDIFEDTYIYIYLYMNIYIYTRDV